MYFCESRDQHRGSLESLHDQQMLQLAVSSWMYFYTDVRMSEKLHLESMNMADDHSTLRTCTWSS